MKKRAPIASVVAVDHDFRQAHLAVHRYLEGKGFTVQSQELKLTQNNRDLNFEVGGSDVAVWLCHGGWDGPIGLFGEWGIDQVDPVKTPAKWKRLTAWALRYLRPRGMLVVHSCHSAGSNKYESEGGARPRWVQQLAQATGLYAAGVQGSTASAIPEWAVQFAKFAVEGTENRQPSQIFGPGGHLRSNWKGWLDDYRRR